MTILRYFFIAILVVASQGAHLTGSQAQNSLKMRLKMDSEESVPVVCLETVSEPTPVVCLGSMPKSTCTKPLNAVTQKEAQAKLLLLTNNRVQANSTCLFDQASSSGSANASARSTYSEGLSSKEFEKIFRNMSFSTQDNAIAQALGVHSSLPTELIRLIIGYAAVGTCQHTYKGSSKGRSVLTLLPCGLLTCGSTASNAIEVWDIERDSQLKTLEGHQYGISALAPLWNSVLISGDIRGGIKIWGLFSEKTKTLKGHARCISAFVVLPNQKDKFASSSFDGEIKIWNAVSGKRLKTLKGHTSSVFALVALPDSKLVSGADFGVLKLWDSTTGQCLSTFNDNPHEITALAALPNGNFVSTSVDDSVGEGHTIKIWNSTTRQYCQLLEERPDINLTLGVLPNGNIVFGADDFSIKIWNPKNRCYESILKGHAGRIENLAVSPEGLLASIDSNKTIKIWS